MEQVIKQLVGFEGWKEAKAMIIEQVAFEQKSINTDQSAEVIATQYKAMVEAERIVRKALDKIDKMGADLNAKPIKYK